MTKDLGRISKLKQALDSTWNLAESIRILRDEVGVFDYPNTMTNFPELHEKCKKILENLKKSS